MPYREDNAKPPRPTGPTTFLEMAKARHPHATRMVAGVIVLAALVSVVMAGMVVFAGIGYAIEWVTDEEFSPGGGAHAVIGVAVTLVSGLAVALLYQLGGALTGDDEW